MPFGRLRRSWGGSPGGQRDRAASGRRGVRGPDLPGGVVLLGRDGCHLCEEARAVVDRVCAEAQLDWTLLRLEDRPDLTDEYSDKVPVLFLDGRERSYWRVAPEDLRRALRRRRGGVN